MGFVIHIGNLYKKIIPENWEEDEEPEEEFYIDELILPDAPDATLDHTNVLCPSASGWSDFCRATDLHDLFYEEHTKAGYRWISHKEDPILLSKYVAGLVRARLDLYKEKYPEATPGWSGATSEICLINYHLARLIWLDWWIQYALEHCKNPAMTIG